MPDAAPSSPQHALRTRLGRAGGVVQRAGHRTLLRFAGGSNRVPTALRPDLSGTRPTDVLVDGHDARAARSRGRDLGLGWCPDATAAWAALGALGVVLRLADDGRRVALLADESGTRSPMMRWAREVGFQPVELGLFDPARTDVAGVDAASLDVVTRLYPRGCTVDDVDATVSRATDVLRPGGALCLTLPLGTVEGDGGVGVAEVRALVARAADAGAELVGDLGVEDASRIHAAQDDAAGAAYGLVRLTFRRR